MSFYNHLLISTLSRSRFWYLNQPKLILHNVKGMPVCGAYSTLIKDNRIYIFKHIPGQMGLNLKVKTIESNQLHEFHNRELSNHILK